MVAKTFTMHIALKVRKAQNVQNSTNSNGKVNFAVTQIIED